MPFNAAGVFNRLYNWVTDRQNGIRILAQRVDAEMDGMAVGLSTMICRDGQSTAIARIPFAQGIAIETGTSGSPSFSVIGDPDTGVDFPAAGDTGALVAGGADILTWTKGDTTTTPATKDRVGITGNVEIGGDYLVSGAPIMPAGIVLPFAGATAPPRMLLCYGQAISRTTYAALFTAIGVTHGAGDSTTTFNVPDMRGRTIFGRDDMGSAAAGRVTSGGSGVPATTLGGVGGHELLQSHGHGVSDPGHRHPFQFDPSPGPGPSLAPLGYGGNGNVSSGTILPAATGISVTAAGGGNSQNIPPAIILNYVITTGPLS